MYLRWRTGGVKPCRRHPSEGNVVTASTIAGVTYHLCVWASHRRSVMTTRTDIFAK